MYPDSISTIKEMCENLQNFKQNNNNFDSLCDSDCNLALFVLHYFSFFKT